MPGKKKILYLFTKNFPFTSSESYLVDELPVLSDYFDKIVLVPCEYYGDINAAKRSFPANVDILHVNDGKFSEEFGNSSLKGMFQLLAGEFFSTADKNIFLRNIKKNISVAKHQHWLAGAFSNYIQSKTGSVNYFYTYWMHHSATMLGVMKKQGKIKSFVSRGHSFDLYNQDWDLAKELGDIPFHQFHLKMPDLVAPISKHGEAHLVKKYPYLKSKVKAYRLGVVDPRATNPFPENENVIVTCSNFSINKGLHRLAEILSKVRCQVSWIHFGSGGDGEVLLKEKIKALPLNIKTDFKGYVDNEKIRRFYSESPVSLFVNLSRVEGIPVSIMEAISFGIPVLATAVYGNPEIANVNTGFSVPFQFDSEEVARHIEKFLTDKEVQRMKRADAYRFFTENFNAETNFKAFASELLKYPN